MSCPCSLCLPVWKSGGLPQYSKGPEEYCLGSGVWLSLPLAPELFICLCVCV